MTATEPTAQASDLRWGQHNNFCTAAERRIHFPVTSPENTDSQH